MSVSLSLSESALRKRESLLRGREPVKPGQFDYGKLPKDFRLLIRRVLEQGWENEGILMSGHWRFKSPDGKHFVVIAGTTTSRRAFYEARARFRKFGAVV